MIMTVVESLLALVGQRKRERERQREESFNDNAEKKKRKKKCRPTMRCTRARTYIYAQSDRR
jgi:hypothetical protein